MYHDRDTFDFNQGHVTKNQHRGRGNRHKCFKIFDEYCSTNTNADVNANAYTNASANTVLE